MTSVLMIGGTGVISGDCTLLGLSRGGFEITLLNRGRTPGVAMDGAHFIHADIDDAKAAERALDGRRFDIVCDFLSYTTEQLARKLALLRGRMRQYIFISSIAAYRPNVHALKTEANSRVGNAQWAYGWDKSLCEKLLREEAAAGGFAFTIVRPGYTCDASRFFNPWTIPHRESWTLADRLLRGAPIILHDDGMALCTVTHSGDFAKGFVGMWGNPAAMDEDFHLTSGEYLTWRRIVEIEADLLGVKPVFCPVPAEEVGFELGYISAQKVIHTTRHDCYDSSKARAAVPEFRCETDFAGIIEKSIRHYRDQPARQKISAEWNAHFDRLAASAQNK